ncbi:hypothetical protein BV20DRAFT_955007 [Pilatotrama ljubarskyi]|nr:hypothetical protein BV20DRAFT_955007 [Pilatotrama ljubarskyi]
MSSLDSVYFSPNPGTYAVIRIDPVAMVEELKLDDAEALSAAKAMHTKSYLICLDYDLELPFPGRPWYGYGSYPVAPCLRPEEPDRGLTSDMSVAIYPNQNHPTGRPPVHPEPAFPYGNCYHWVSFSIDIRVRARPELFDESRAVNLPPKEQVEMDCYFGRDLIRAAETKRMRQEMLRSQTDEQVRSQQHSTGPFDPYVELRSAILTSNHAGACRSRADWS